MNIDALTPTTIEGVKRLANKLKKANGLQQSAALDRAAAQAGFRDFREAHLVLSAPSIVVRITGHFREDGKRKTLVTHVQLGRGIRSFLRPQDLRVSERFHNMSIVADDHIQGHFGRADETYVRHCMAKTARALQFMDATELKPSTAKIYPRRTYSPEHRLPGQDHAITWRDPRTKALVMMDEPYGYINRRAEERADWASRNGYVIQRLEWGGTYCPEGQSVCDLVSHAEKGVPIGKILEKLKKAAPGFRESAAAWTLHDGIYDEPTPNEINEREAKSTAKDGSGRFGHRAAARHGTSLTYGNGQKRPAGALPLERHAEIGLILRKAGLVVSERRGAGNAIVSLRSMLEDWANAETNGKLSNEELFALYYGDAIQGRLGLSLQACGCGD
ncbi:DUF5623 domain-containing protein [Rhodovulum sulfidophilum]|uniref:DUF5623 domain-containing protein n=1 Tax=Rhodovulum sulfidophilum TaxID=35806 RepID=UPI001924A58D|nr:DUF5623 domain-containing protein [Rhodovulum sulfidophilum]MBL3576182.1 DUF5623 domain-containing protein [Rhodovulum sulfidophilum]MCE8433467.1 DUF5623 domain-containing protein [Rhodovulum sulfidophilum]MCF4119010.1 DUF5623 domain-containing protein [Rhodovulum sulfidophilum]